MEGGGRESWATDWLVSVWPTFKAALGQAVFALARRRAIQERNESGERCRKGPDGWQNSVSRASQSVPRIRYAASRIAR